MKKIILLTVLILLLSSVYLFSAVPCKINYQGRLIKDNVPVDGTKTMKFSIYDSAVGPTLLWTSGDVNVEVHNGLFRYVLDLSSIDWAAGQALYLEVVIDGETLTPREELSAYPYAINSHLLEGKTTDYFLNASGDTQTKQGNLNIMGNVGIGTTDPGAKLHIGGAAGTDGIMFPDGTLQTTAAAVKVGQGSVGNGNNFNVQCGMSGTVLFCLKFDFIARYGDFGVMTARLRSQRGSSTLKTRTGRTMEFDSRYSSTHVQIFYISTGNNPGETLTFNAYTPDGSHLINNPDYWYIGL